MVRHNYNTPHHIMPYHIISYRTISYCYLSFYTKIVDLIPNYILLNYYFCNIILFKIIYIPMYV